MIDTETDEQLASVSDSEHQIEDVKDSFGEDVKDGLLFGQELNHEIDVISNPDVKLLVFTSTQFGS